MRLRHETPTSKAEGNNDDSGAATSGGDANDSMPAELLAATAD
jgi:hypothetical protein